MNKMSEICIANIVSLRVSQAVYRNTNRVVTKCIVTPLVMPSNTATKISTIFRDRVITELIYLLISAAMASMMFRRLIWIHLFYHFLAIRLYHEFLSQLNSHFDIAFFEHYLVQTTTAAKQANEILWNFTYPPWNTSLYNSQNCKSIHWI